MAKNPYEQALHLLRRDAGADNSQNTRSDAMGFMDDTERVSPATEPVNISHQQTSNNNDAHHSGTAQDDDDDDMRFYTYGENGIQDQTEDYNRGLFGNVSRTQQYGKSTNLTINGGTFLQSNVGGKEPVTIHNVNSTIIAATYKDSAEAREKRRTTKVDPSQIMIQGKVFSTDSFFLPDNSNFWVNDIKVKPSRPEDYQRHLVDQSIYPVTSWGQSRALIINNMKFSGRTQPRTGGDIDASRLNETLGQLGFKVEVHTDKNKPQILQILKEFTQSRENAHASMSLVYIGSHGEQNDNQDCFIGTEGQKISMEEMSEFFLATKCPGLARKPKLFFLQFCRQVRNKKNTTAPDSVEEMNTPIRMDWTTTQGDANPGAEDYAQAPIHKAQNLADMLWSFATAPGTKAYRDTEDGSWFVTTLCKVLQDESRRDDLLSMLTKVNNSVMARSGIENRNVAVQMAELKSTLNKKVFFFPQQQETPNSN